MSTLQAWLNPTKESKTEEVIISDRFIDPETKKPVPVKIRTITQDENDQLVKRSTVRQKEKGQVYETMDKSKYQGSLVVSCTVEPDFRNAELCKAYGEVDPNKVPGKMFWAGEFGKLVEAILKINGFRDPETESIELAEEAKNS